MADKQQRSGARKSRRAVLGEEWITTLAGGGASGGGSPYLGRRSDGRVFLVDGSDKREVKSGVLAHGLELALGPIRDSADQDLQARPDGVPVELLEDSDGVFLTYGGERHNVRGMPLPHPVPEGSASVLPKGHDVDVARANVSYHRLRQMMSAQHQVDRVKSAVRRKGIFGATKTALRRARGSIKKGG